MSHSRAAERMNVDETPPPKRETLFHVLGVPCNRRKSSQLTPVLPPVVVMPHLFFHPGALLAAIAGKVLIPDIAELLDAEALVGRIITSKVAVGLEAERRVAAGEDELLKVAHISDRGTDGYIYLYMLEGSRRRAGIALEAERELCRGAFG